MKILKFNKTLTSLTGCDYEALKALSKAIKQLKKLEILDSSNDYNTK